jgi:protein-S-isoprenylcysteine O-methyltransferase Ste14
MTTNSDQPRQPEPIDRRRLFVGLGRVLLFFVVCLLLPAGTWTWTRGWLFFFVVNAALIVGALYLRRVNPEIFAARINRHEGTKHWDRILLAILLLTEMAIPIVAALDDARFHWFPMPWWVCGIGYTLLIAGMVGFTWAQSVNKFFEPTVRIQTDRDQRVIDTGPYAIVRHPGYVAACLLFLGMPLALGSLWALIPAVLLCVILVVRTIWEDRTLRMELTGYNEYTHRVRYRLIPGVW